MVLPEFNLHCNKYLKTIIIFHKHETLNKSNEIFSSTVVRRKRKVCFCSEQSKGSISFRVALFTFTNETDHKGDWKKRLFVDVLRYK